MSFLHVWLRGFSLPPHFTLNVFFAKYVYTAARARAKDCARGPESAEALGVCSPAHPLGSIVDELEPPKPANAVVAIVWYFVTAQGETRPSSGPVGKASSTQSLQAKGAGLNHGAVHRPSRQRGHACRFSCGPSSVHLVRIKIKIKIFFRWPLSTRVLLIIDGKTSARPFSPLTGDRARWQF